ncbi:glycosyltransferase family 9 protein [Rhodococcus fascians]|nr:glycosyltransferase family 9 protein [Rhodococcus fascians]MBY4417655.1 glycosyltransferase family 9 protein [Rhodococcus fascians]
MPVRGANVLVARLDSMGDVLVTGPAIRAVARASARVTALVGPRGVAAAQLLPGVDAVRILDAPWVSLSPEALDRGTIDRFVADTAAENYDAAFVFTSFHQSPLPLALLLRMAGVEWVGAISVDYPGSLLDLRHSVSDDIPEAERALSLVEAAGYARDGEGSSLRLRPRATGPGNESVDSSSYVVYHPGAAVPARRPTARHSRDIVRALSSNGFRVVVTGGPDELELAQFVADGKVPNLAGRLTLGELADLYAGAEAVVVPNTGPAHLAAAVGVPTVSLFAPVVPAVRWAPHHTSMILLGDQDAACKNSRARTCPVSGHPCLGSVSPQDVVDAVRALLRRNFGAHTMPDTPAATVDSGR